MTREEFNTRIDALNAGMVPELQVLHPTGDEYKTIETVYTWYPDLNSWLDKDVCANLYFKMGMIIFYDMEKRAIRRMELTTEIDLKKSAISKLDRERMA